MFRGGLFSVELSSLFVTGRWGVGATVALAAFQTVSVVYRYTGRGVVSVLNLPVFLRMAGKRAF